MLIGAAREIINPEIGHHLFGYGPDYPNTGVHDDISVTAIYLNDGVRQAFLLNYDLGGLVAYTIKSIRDGIAAATGVKSEHVFLACTHTHSAPAPIERHPFDPDNDIQNCRKDYMQRLRNWSTQAAVAAKANAEECDLRYNYTSVAENMNRRYTFPDRRFLYIPDNKQLLGLSDGYVDRELGIIAFKKKGAPNQYKAIIANYTCHPLCVGNTSNLVSADFQGVMRRHVEESFAGCLCLSTTGAAGDNHPLVPEGGFVTSEEMGARLAKQVIARCYDSVVVDYDTQLRLAYPDVTLDFKDAATREMLPEKEVRHQELAHENEEYKTQISLLGIGPILLAGVPGEFMAEHGAMLKWSSPFLRSYMLFTSTDLAGYFPTVNQFYWGGYEPNTSHFVRGSGEKVIREILESADGLLRAQPLHLPALDASGTDGHPR